jgi:cobalt/nickel transport system permease protein
MAAFANDDRADYTGRAGLLVLFPTPILAGYPVHIQDGLLDVKTCVATGAIAAGAIAFALRKLRQNPNPGNTPLMGVVAACLFAAQMLNFPIPGATSGHLLGGVLAAVMLGPWSGLIVVTVVLAVQCLLMADGGSTALGANILNVGVIGCLVGSAIVQPIHRWIGGPRGLVAGSVIASWFTVALGATACSIELATSGTYALPPTLGIMLLVHSMIGLGEALITGLAIAFVLRTRPDLIERQRTSSTGLVRTGQVVVGGLAIAFVLAIFLSPWASQLPDGLDSTLERLGIDTTAHEPFLPGLMPDYVPHGMENVRWAGSVAGAVGTLVTFAVAFVVSMGLRSTVPAAIPPHAH